MPTVIDSLIVSLGLDSSKFTAGQKKYTSDLKQMEDDSDKSTKRIDASARRTMEGFEKMRREVRSLVGAFIAAKAFKEFAVDMARNDAATGRLAHNLGLTASKLKAWEGVAVQFGATAQDMDASFRLIQKSAQDYQQTGNLDKGMADFFARARIDANEFFAITTTTEQRNKMLADGLNRMSNADAQYWGQRAGFNEHVITMYRETKDTINDLVAQQERLNNVTAAGTEAAKKLSAEWAVVGQAFEGVTRGIVQHHAPALTAFAKVLGNSIKLLDGSVLYDYTHFGGPKADAPTPLNAPPPSKPIRRPSPSSGSPSPVQPYNSQSDIDSLVKMGWTRAQAIGIAANIARESSGNAEAVGDNGKAYGLAQWHPDRQANFKKWSGTDIRQSTRQQQLAFINYELRYGTEKTAGKALSATTNAGDAASTFSTAYERPANMASEAALRSAMATRMAGGGASTTEVKIGNVNVYTQATDANGIARDMSAAVRRQSFAAQANTGVN